MKRIISSVVGIGVLAMTVAASAQTLADIAKKDTDRRKEVKHPAKVYTNDDVQNVKPILPMMENDGNGTKPMDPSSPNASANASSSSAATSVGDDPSAPKTDAAPRPGVKAGEEQQWRARMAAAHEAVSRTQLQLEGMRNHAAQMTAASAAASEEQRGTFQKQQQDALQEYDKLRADLQKYQKALSELEAEAHRAGVPPGWLR
jgi:hypothetical protein